MTKSDFTFGTLWHGFHPVNLLHIFRTPFLKNTSGLLLFFAQDEGAIAFAKMQRTVKPMKMKYRGLKQLESVCSSK